MTAIAGIVEGGRVYVGGDSAGPNHGLGQQIQIARRSARVRSS